MALDIDGTSEEEGTMRTGPSRFAGTLAGLAVLLPAVLAAQQVIISTAVVDYPDDSYVLLVKGQNFGQYLPRVLWDQQSRVPIIGFTPAPDVSGFQTFTVELPSTISGPPPPGSYQLTVTRMLRGGKADSSSSGTARFEVTIGAVGPRGLKGDRGDQGDPGPAGLTLPYSGSTTSSSAAFAVTNTGSSGTGVYGWGDYGVIGGGRYYGVVGSSSNYGVYGVSLNWGVFGNGQACGVRGSSDGFGVWGSSRDRGIFGDAEEIGVYGSGGTWGVFSAGDFAATGAKSFVEPHPTDPTTTIRYVALEGPEAGTYFRGTARTVGREAVIEVPETFRIVTADEGLTVQLTPVGEFAQMAVFSQDLNQIVVRSTLEVTFHYLVQGVRRAFKDWEVVAEGQEFRPNSPDDKMPSWLTEEAKRRLISNGTYNTDGTVNMSTAEGLGWAQKWRDDDARVKAAKEAAAAKSK
jgi:hypothetical protein